MKKKMILLALGASTFLNGCGSLPAQNSQSQVAAADETPKPDDIKLEIYKGTEKGKICQLSVQKDEKNKIISMIYESKGCGGMFGCELRLSKESVVNIDTSFNQGPSLQFPGYTRIGFRHGLFPVLLMPGALPGSLVMWDEFILAKDNFTKFKVVSRAANTYPVVPVPMQDNVWESECIDVKKVEK